MPRNASVSVENNFSQGLITEVTGVNSPENSVSETQNMVYDRRGRAFPREGLDYEDEFVLQDLNEYEGSKTEFIWDTAQTGSFVVMQVGSTIWFFETGGAVSLSSALAPFSIDLLDYKTPGTSDYDVIHQSVSFSSGKDYLFITHPRCEPLYASYNSTTETLTVHTITIKVRDFEGVDDGLEYGERPPKPLSEAHKYNLMNQGWYAQELAVAGSAAFYNVLGRAVSQTTNELPSNSDIQWLCRFTDGGTGSTVFTWNSRNRVQPGNSAAPKGHYIFNAFDIDRNGLTGDGIGAMTTADVPGTTSNGARPSSVAFYMGRVWYAGVSAEGYRNSVYFSQVVERDNQIGLCYQQNDPTSEHAFDLLASDGGVIRILDIGSIIDIRAIGKSLYVFASNGVWSVSGTETTPFSATDYSVSKVSNFGVQGKNSIVELGELPVWWNYEGIYALQKDPGGFSSSVTNLTENTIQTFYNDIPATSKLYAKGMFNDQSNLVYWLYSSTETEDPYDYDRILVIDTVSKAFYPLELSTTNHTITGLFPLRNVQNTETQENVTTSAGVVTNLLDDPVWVTLAGGLGIGHKEFKFVTWERGETTMTFSNFRDGTNTDFESTDNPQTYPYYFITGYRIRGELLKKFQTNYLAVVAEDTSNTNQFCMVQGVWDYADDHTTGRYTNPQQVYRPGLSTNVRYHRHKLKMRGNGYSLQFRFFGDRGKPFVIIGWAGFETSNAIP